MSLEQVPQWMIDALTPTHETRSKHTKQADDDAKLEAAKAKLSELVSKMPAPTGQPDVAELHRRITESGIMSVVRIGQIWSYLGSNRAYAGKGPVYKCTVVSANNSAESPGSWVMRSPQGRTLYMHKSAMDLGEWVRDKL